MRPRWWHPSNSKLRTWLIRGDDKIDAHIATCERCATRLEDLSEPAVPLGDALRAMLAPPLDLQPRLQAGIAIKMQTRDDLQLLAEMMGLPGRTLRALSPPEEDSTSQPDQDEDED